MAPSGNFPFAYFKTRGFVPGGIITNARDESLALEALPPFLRTLLVTDGTVTKHLEAYFWEEVAVENLGQGMVRLATPFPWLGFCCAAVFLLFAVLAPWQRHRRGVLRGPQARWWHEGARRSGYRLGAGAHGGRYGRQCQ
jgi:hypothetical protein